MDERIKSLQDIIEKAFTNTRHKIQLAIYWRENLLFKALYDKKYNWERYKRILEMHNVNDRELEETQFPNGVNHAENTSKERKNFQQIEHEQTLVTDLIHPNKSGYQNANNIRILKVEEEYYLHHLTKLNNFELAGFAFVLFGFIGLRQFRIAKSHRALFRSHAYYFVNPFKKFANVQLIANQALCYISLCVTSVTCTFASYLIVRSEWNRLTKPVLFEDSLKLKYNQQIRAYYLHK